MKTRSNARWSIFRTIGFTLLALILATSLFSQSILAMQSDEDVDYLLLPQQTEWDEFLREYLNPLTTQAALAIDRSGSMTGAKLAAAKNASSLFVDLVPDNNEIAVTSYSGSARTNFPWTPVDDATREQAIDAIRSISAGGSTSIGAGLQEALNQLLQDPGASRTILLLSDGLENTSPMVSKILPDVIASGVTVHTVAVGADADQALMTDIANQTGGSYHYQDRLSTFYRVYLTMIASIFGYEQPFVVTDSVAQGAQSEHFVTIDPSREVKFVLAWENVDSDLDLQLVQPDGTLISTKRSDPGSNIKFTERDVYKIIHIQSPASGQWSVRVIANTLSGGSEEYTLAVLSRSDLGFDVRLDRDQYNVGEPITLIASISHPACPGSIDNATVTAEVIPPQFSFSDVQWAVQAMRETRPPDQEVPFDVHDIPGLTQQTMISPTTIVLQSVGHGEYRGTYYDALVPGSYTFLVRASGTSCEGPFTRQTRLSTFVQPVAVPIVYLEPQEQTIGIDDETTVEVWVNNVTDFYGVEFKLEFDGSTVEGTSVVEGAAFTAYPGQYQVLQNAVGAGTVEFAASLLRIAKAPPLNGNLHLATIAFKGKAAGTSPLTWAVTKLSDSNGQPIQHTARGGSIVVQAVNGTVTGRTSMQGRTGFDGVRVTLHDGSSWLATTDIGGWYTFADVPVGTYDLTFAHDLYLVATLASCPVKAGETAWMPDVTLLGGDLNGDTTIDVLDIALAASHFGSAWPGVDINADGLVDIFDLVLIGRNFGLRGPIIHVCAP